MRHFWTECFSSGRSARAMSTLLTAVVPPSMHGCKAVEIFTNMSSYSPRAFADRGVRIEPRTEHTLTSLLAKWDSERVAKIRAEQDGCGDLGEIVVMTEEEKHDLAQQLGVLTAMTPSRFGKVLNGFVLHSDFKGAWELVQMWLGYNTATRAFEETSNAAAFPFDVRADNSTLLGAQMRIHNAMLATIVVVLTNLRKFDELRTFLAHVVQPKWTGCFVPDDEIFELQWVLLETAAGAMCERRAFLMSKGGQVTADFVSSIPREVYDDYAMIVDAVVVSLREGGGEGRTHRTWDDARSSWMDSAAVKIEQRARKTLRCAWTTFATHALQQRELASLRTVTQVAPWCVFVLEALDASLDPSSAAATIRTLGLLDRIQTPVGIAAAEQSVGTFTLMQEWEDIQDQGSARASRDQTRRHNRRERMLRQMQKPRWGAAGYQMIHPWYDENNLVELLGLSEKVMKRYLKSAGSEATAFHVESYSKPSVAVLSAYLAIRAYYGDSEVVACIKEDLLPHSDDLLARYLRRLCWLALSRSGHFLDAGREGTAFSWMAEEWRELSPRKQDHTALSGLLLQSAITPYAKHITHSRGEVQGPPTWIYCCPWMKFSLVGGCSGESLFHRETSLRLIWENMYLLATSTTCPEATALINLPSGVPEAPLCPTEAATLVLLDQAIVVLHAMLNERPQQRMSALTVDDSGESLRRLVKFLDNSHPTGATESGEGDESQHQDWIDFEDAVRCHVEGLGSFAQRRKWVVSLLEKNRENCATNVHNLTVEKIVITFLTLCPHDAELLDALVGWAEKALVAQPLFFMVLVGCRVLNAHPDRVPSLKNVVDVALEKFGAELKGRLRNHADFEVYRGGEGEAVILQSAQEPSATIEDLRRTRLSGILSKAVEERGVIPRLRRNMACRPFDSAASLLTALVDPDGELHC